MHAICKTACQVTQAPPKHQSCIMWKLLKNLGCEDICEILAQLTGAAGLKCCMVFGSGWYMFLNFTLLYYIYFTVLLLLLLLAFRQHVKVWMEVLYSYQKCPLTPTCSAVNIIVNDIFV